MNANIFICTLQNFAPMENLERITLLRNKILEHIQNNTMNISDELQIFEAISKKYNMRTITNYGNSQTPKISYNGVLDRINHSKCASFQIDKVLFICM